MIEGRMFFSDNEDIKHYVDQCEDNFELQLKSVSERIISNDAKIITICGPTCSGKTTTAKKLLSYLTLAGKRVHVVSFDDFYKDRDEIERICKSKGIELDFESAWTLDLSFLSSVFEHIANGEDVDIPKFDFKSGKRVGYEKYKIDSEDIFVFEGIQALYDEVIELYRGIDHYSIFICAEEGIKLDDVYIDKETVRFLRRIIRDKRHRAASASATYSMWSSVRKNEETNIFPNSKKADFFINSTLPYELCVEKNDIIAALSEVDANDEFYPISKGLIHIIEKVQSISREYVPSESVLREFID